MDADYPKNGVLIPRLITPIGTDYTAHRANWQGIDVEFRYAPDWLHMKSVRCSYAHLEITALRPERAPLPITDTGYRSHFTTPDDVEACGRPVALVLAWLNEEAQSATWKRREEEARQPSLF